MIEQKVYTEIKETQVAHIKKPIYLRRAKLKKGQKMFVHDASTNRVSEATYKKSVVDLDRNTFRKYICKPGEAYCFAINLQNAIRKFQKEGYEVFIPQ